MKLNEIQTYFRKWINNNASSEIDRALDGELISIKELLSTDEQRINHSFYQCILDANCTKSGIPKIFMYYCVDILKFDTNGDIIDIKTVDYNIVDSNA